jgi:hypothetical protein
MNGVTLRQLENFSGGLIGGNFADSTNVAIIVAEWLGNKQFNETQNLILRVLTRTDRNHICIVVLTGKLCG